MIAQTRASEPKRSIFGVSQLWLALAVILLGLVVISALHSRAVDAERAAASREAECVRLGHALLGASDMLTDSVRKFVITADAAYLQAYWYEIDTRRTREGVLTRLDELGAPAEELELLETAKRQSDELVTTEIRGMKLMLVVMGVPEESMPPSVQSFRLLAADAELPATEKVALAQSIMFDKAYSEAKARITGPIERFQRTLQERVSRETTAARRRTDALTRGLFAGIWAGTLLILLVVWRRLLDVKDDVVKRD